MEFDWKNAAPRSNGSLKTTEIEESFEDPFAIRLLPDSARFAVQARFFNLGRTASAQGVFSVYRTNGKVIRVLCARPFTREEQFFYDRKVEDVLSQQKE